MLEKMIYFGIFIELLITRSKQDNLWCFSQVVPFENPQVTKNSTQLITQTKRLNPKLKKYKK